MLELTTWIMIGFVSGSVPWALLIGKTVVSKDIRTVGDGNPGAANVWKSGGWILGMLSVILEIGKGMVPVCLATRYFYMDSNAALSTGLALIAISPIVGHGWSPFLRFKGGKTLATSGGSWIAITGGIAFPVGCLFLLLMHCLQRNHAITVTFCWVGLLVVFLPLNMSPSIALFGVTSLLIVVYKHRFEYGDGLIFRDWVHKLARALSW